jgi:tetratricopeptide (TPR) repeat protein
MGYDILPEEGLINSIGYFYISEKKFDKAAAFLDLNIQNHPKSNNVYDSRGDCYLAAGDSLKALEFFKKALEVGDNDFSQEKIDALTKNLEE